MVTSASLNQLTNNQLYFKCENFQEIGAFKIRGASNAVASLTAEEKAKGVATYSSGNHGAGLACAAKQLGIKCVVVMPKNSPKSKVKNVQSYGAEIIYCEVMSKSQGRNIS